GVCAKMGAFPWASPPRSLNPARAFFIGRYPPPPRHRDDLAFGSMLDTRFRRPEPFASQPAAQNRALCTPMTTSQPSPLTSRRSGPLKGRVRVPGDKSISHRALIFGALTVGETRISGLLEGEDVLNTGKAMRALGASVERTGEGAWRVHGVGVGGFREPASVLDFGNSATGCRLVMGAVAGCPITATFDGDASLRRRPMQRILEPVGLVGARALAATDGGL